jgi:hypothetical protein
VRSAAAARSHPLEARAGESLEKEIRWRCLID